MSRPSAIRCKWIDARGKRCQSKDRYPNSIFCGYHYRVRQYQIAKAELEIAEEEMKK